MKPSYAFPLLLLLCPSVDARGLDIIKRVNTIYRESKAKSDSNTSTDIDSTSLVNIRYTDDEKVTTREDEIDRVTTRETEIDRVTTREAEMIVSPITIGGESSGLGISLSAGYRIYGSVFLPSAPDLAFNFVENARFSAYLFGFSLSKSSFIFGGETDYTTGRYIENRQTFSATLTIHTLIDFPTFVRSFIPLTPKQVVDLRERGLFILNYITFGAGREILSPTDRIRLGKIFTQFSFYLDGDINLLVRVTKIYPYNQFTFLSGNDPAKSAEQVQVEYLQDCLTEKLEEEEDTYFSFFTSRDKKERARSLIDSLRRDGSLAKSRIIGRADLRELEGCLEITCSLSLSNLV